MTAPAKVRQLPARQRVRRALLLISFLLFPATLYYFSPILIMESAACVDNCNQNAIRFTFRAGK